MASKPIMPITPIFDELQEAAIENGYAVRVEVDGIAISARSNPYDGQAAIAVHDTSSGLALSFLAIETDRIDLTARILVAGVRAERQILEALNRTPPEVCRDRDPAPSPRRN